MASTGATAAGVTMAALPGGKFVLHMNNTAGTGDGILRPPEPPATWATAFGVDHQLKPKEYSMKRGQLAFQMMCLAWFFTIFAIWDWGNYAVDRWNMHIIISGFYAAWGFGMLWYAKACWDRNMCWCCALEFLFHALIGASVAVYVQYKFEAGLDENNDINHWMRMSAVLVFGLCFGLNFLLGVWAREEYVVMSTVWLKDPKMMAAYRADRDGFMNAMRKKGITFPTDPTAQTNGAYFTVASVEASSSAF